MCLDKIMPLNKSPYVCMNKTLPHYKALPHDKLPYVCMNKTLPHYKLPCVYDQNHSML